MPARIQAWYLVCRSSDVPPRTVRSVDFLGQPLALFRTEGGAVRALSAHCWHMGTHLGTGRVLGEHIQCPLHHWEFDGRGVCRRMPGGRPPPEAHQVPYPVAERFGGVFLFNGPTPLSPLPSFDLAPEHDLYFGHGRPVHVRCPWYALASNGFDLQHLQTVHARALRQPAVVERIDRHRLSLRYVSRIVGRSAPDRVVRRLSGDRVEVTITCWSGSIVTVESRLGRMRSLFLASFAPVGDGSESEVSFIVGVRRKPSAALNALHVLGSQLLFSRFLERDVKVLEGIRFRPRLPRAEGEPLLHYLRFLHDLPPALDAWTPAADTADGAGWPEPTAVRV